ncbi:MAG: hypothetical protein Q8S20_20000 [Sulfuritalea sp.]|nr:hypothetical protein [Sulfuritalea sp.]
MARYHKNKTNPERPTTLCPGQSPLVERISSGYRTGDSCGVNAKIQEPTKQKKPKAAQALLWAFLATSYCRHHWRQTRMYLFQTMIRQFLAANYQECLIAVNHFFQKCHTGGLGAVQHFLGAEMLRLKIRFPAVVAVLSPQVAVA